jgi:hypothetical protein
VWHTALTAELAKFSMPPRNPYLASEPIHYYWTYFLLPAAVSQAGPSSVRSVESCLKVNAILTGLLLIASVFMLAWTTTSRPWVTTAAVSLALLAGSFEGTYEIYRLWTRGQSLSALRDTNIDAITEWHFGGHRIDGLPRCLWYVPQHSMAYALGLVSLTAVSASGAAGSSTAIALEGLVLGGAVAINPFVGGIFAFVGGLGSAGRPSNPRVNRDGRAARGGRDSGPGLALSWCVASKMVEGGRWRARDRPEGRVAPRAALDALPLSAPCCCPCWPRALLRHDSFRALVPATLLSATALAVMFLLRRASTWRGSRFAPDRWSRSPHPR